MPKKNKIQKKTQVKVRELKPKKDPRGGTGVGPIPINPGGPGGRH